MPAIEITKLEIDSPDGPPLSVPVPLPGKTRAIIAVIDSGFDLGHPSVRYVERALHFNAVEYLERKGPGQSAGRARGPFDASRAYRAHGTAVAGAAAGFRRDPRDPLLDSVAPGFPVMPLKVGVKPTAEQVAAGIAWAVAHGARVINMSFKVLPTLELRRAIERAWDSGLVLCAAAGNYRREHPFRGVDFPARHPNVIAVGALDRLGRRKRFDLRLRRDWGSQYGAELDVMAPGIGVRTLDDRDALGNLPGDFSLNSVGTSIATPQAAGLAALLFGLDPELSNGQVRDAIEMHCRKLTGYDFERVAGRRWAWNQEVGYGAIDVQAAVRHVVLDREQRTKRGAQA